MSEKAIPSGLGQGRQQFLELIAEVRPELHRYCARITGSVIDGEDVVQDVLAKAFYELSKSLEVPSLRPWLFRVAHNAAIDFCRRHDRARVDPQTDRLEEVLGSEDADPAIVRAALTSFLALPVRQRSAVILKDVLAFSPEEIAETMETTVEAVKAALVRGRRQLRSQAAADSSAPSFADRATLKAELGRLHQYAALFNARNWEGLRGLLASEVQLDLVSQAARRGPQVGQYFGRYDKEAPLRLAAGLLEGQPSLAAYVPADSPRPSYFILLRWRGDQVCFIRDFKYVPYISDSAIFQPLT